MDVFLLIFAFAYLFVFTFALKKAQMHIAEQQHSSEGPLGHAEALVLAQGGALRQLTKQASAGLADIQARAKTVRIGKVRWPPPIRESELFESEMQRKLELQRKIHREILPEFTEG